MTATPDPAEAERLVEPLLSPLGDRWLHTRAVAARASELSPAVPDVDRDLLVTAAWLHDIGYAESVAATGFHPLDGARYLSSVGYPARLCALDAHHSSAACEAEERELLAALEEWPREESDVADALWTADMTTGPSGQRLD